MSKKDKEIVDTSQNIASLREGHISFDDLDRWFDDLFSRRWPHAIDWRWPLSEKESSISAGLPKVDIIDHDDEIELQAALPGVKKEDLDVSIAENSVTLRVSIRQEQQNENKHYFRREISRGEFQRTLSLPAHVDGDQAKASFKDGMLNITLPKTEVCKRKSIEIQ